MINKFGWMQLATSDSGKAKSFYGDLFDWKLTSMDKPDGSPYIEIDAGEGACAGISPGQHPGHSVWIPFVNVDKLTPYREKAEKLGAELVVPETDLGEGEGFFCAFLDPTGAVIGLWAPEK